jgi:DNA-binding response OmpR family regulator
MTVENSFLAGAPDSAPLQSGSRLGRCILVADDDESIRSLNTKVLSDSGYEVDAAEDGEAAWDRLQLKDYDLVVTDQNMPKLTGMELIHKLKAVGFSVPVIMVTGTLPADSFGSPPSVQPAMVLLKPYSPQELLESVEAVLSTSNKCFGDIISLLDWQTPPSTRRFTSEH